MRLGELRTVIREMDNKLIVKVANYDTTKGVEIFDVDFDISNDNELYLRIIKGDLEWVYVVVVLVSKVMVGVVGGISLQVEMCIVLIIKGNGSIRVGDVWMTEKQELFLDKVIDWLFPIFVIEVFVFGNICLIIVLLLELGIIWMGNDVADSCAMGFYNHMLNRLKKELKEWLKNDLCIMSIKVQIIF